MSELKKYLLGLHLLLIIPVAVYFLVIYLWQKGLWSLNLTLVVIIATAVITIVYYLKFIPFYYYRRLFQLFSKQYRELDFTYYASGFGMPKGLFYQRADKRPVVPYNLSIGGPVLYKETGNFSINICLKNFTWLTYRSVYNRFYLLIEITAELDFEEEYAIHAPLLPRPASISPGKPGELVSEVQALFGKLGLNKFGHINLSPLGIVCASPGFVEDLQTLRSWLEAATGLAEKYRS